MLYSKQLVVERGSVARVQSDCMQNKGGMHCIKIKESHLVFCNEIPVFLCKCHEVSS